jgi:hypothetical protein
MPEAGKKANEREGATTTGSMRAGAEGRSGKKGGGARGGGASASSSAGKGRRGTRGGIHSAPGIKEEEEIKSKDSAARARRAE